MKNQLIELFIEELGTVIGGANPPSSGPGGNQAINEGGGHTLPGSLPRDGSSGPGGNLAISEGGGHSLPGSLPRDPSSGVGGNLAINEGGGAGGVQL
jgi:hypothetical protein